MSSLSRCTAAHDAPKALPPLALIKVMAVMAVLLSFGLAHLALRFHLSQIQRETSQLQRLQGDLASEVKGLQGQTEELKHPKRLYDYGTAELGMAPVSPNEAKRTLKMNREVYQRYELARASLDARNGAPAAEANDGAWLEKFGDRLGLISQAVAGEKK